VASDQREFFGERAFVLRFRADTEDELAAIYEKAARWSRNRLRSLRVVGASFALIWLMTSCGSEHDGFGSGARRGGATPAGDLVGAQLQGANLSRVDLAGRVMHDVNLRSANLAEARLAGTDLRGAEMTGANLSSGILAGADLRGASMWNVDLTGATLKGAKFRGASVNFARAGRADFEGADLSFAVFLETDFRGANLRNVILNKTGFREANFRGADLSGVDMAGADWTGATCPDGHVVKADETCEGHTQP
jgi:hypothetical protein